MRKLIPFIIYTILILLIGRSLTFLPRVDLRSEDKKTDALRRKVEEFIKDREGEYSIYYKDLKTEKEFGIDSDKVLTGGSLNKLLIISYLYNQAAKKKINLEERVALQKEDIQDYGTGSLRYQKPGTLYTLKTLTKLSLKQSDNTAAHLLAVKLEIPNIQKYAQRLGLFSTDMQSNKTTARDMGRILERIYMKKITSPPLTRELLDFMKDTDFEDRLARNFRGEVTVYHKAADIANMVHDVGIIDSTTVSGQGNGNPFILVILTLDVTNEEEVKKTIGELAKTIYEERL